MYLIFCNTGARHRFVYNVRLLVQQGERVTLPIGQWLKTVKPQDDEHSLTAAGGDYASAFAISCSGHVERASLFKAPPTAARWLQEGVYRCTLEARIDCRWRQPAWKPLTVFTITLTAQSCAALEQQGWTNCVAESAAS